MANNNWTSDRIPSQKGKTILITGANSGIGLEAATVLSSKGANIIMAVRTIEKRKEAVIEIKRKNPTAKLELMQLDLSDFDSIRRFSEEFHNKHTQLHSLINNAGVMNPVKRELTKQNFEVQFGTNHLWHFLLTGLLFDIIKNTPKSRIVTQSSAVHKAESMKPDIHFDDLNWERSYDSFQAYAQSKLANLLFTYELDRKLKANHIDTIATAAHPGWTKTNLQGTSGFFVNKVLNNLVAQSVEMGTLPILRAATEEYLVGSEYFGPTKMNELRGYPELVKSSDKSYNKALAERLWQVSEELTNVHFNFNKNDN